MGVKICYVSLVFLEKTRIKWRMSHDYEIVRFDLTCLF